MIPETLTQKKRIWLWASFDFANSLGFVTVTLYFPLWLVKDHHVSDLWVSVPVALSTIVLFFTIPPLGTLSDRLQRRHPFLIFTTLLACFTLLLLGLIGMNVQTFTPFIFATVIILYFLFQYFYQASLGFYYSFLHQLSNAQPKEKISGLGFAAGQLGNVVGLIVALPFAIGTIPLWSQNSRATTFLIGAILFFLCALPMLFFFKEDQYYNLKHADIERKGWMSSFTNTFKDLRHIRRYPGILSYLLVYYFFADAILTLQLFSGLYFEVVGGLNDQQKTFLGIGTLLIAILGGLLSARISQQIKSMRRSIALFILSMSIALLGLSIAKGLVFLIGISLLNGFFFGAVFSLSRAYFSELVPPDRQGQFFSVYVLFERFASVLGPLVWSGTVLLSASLGTEMQYRLGMFSLSVLVAISFIILQMSKEHAKKDGSVTKFA